MLNRTIVGFLVIAMTVSGALGGAQEQEAQSKAAEEMVKAGKFDQAEAAYRELLKKEPENARYLARAGHLALLSNRFEDARSLLEKAASLKPDDKFTRISLAETYYRQDDFAKATPLLRAIGQEPVAKKLESFVDRKPYQIENQPEVLNVKFEITDPLPIVRVQVNGREEVNFFIDTGASEIYIDAEYARELGLETFGEQTGSFAGGKRAGVTQGRIDSLGLGGMTVKNLPVHILGTRGMSGPIFGGRRIDGIIGTTFLYHFLATLDYPNGQLVLRKKTAEQKRVFEDAVGKGIEAIPFWMEGDHYIVAWGQVESSEPVLLFVDTGLAGGGVTLPKSTIEQAGIALDESRAGEGVGGGGKVRVVPFTVKKLSLGPIVEQDVRGLFLGAFPLENAMGFRIGGIISHGFFRPYALTFDFESMRLYVQKSDGR